MSTADPAATVLPVEDDGPTRTFLAGNLTPTATTCWWPIARAMAGGCFRRSFQFALVRTLASDPTRVFTNDNVLVYPARRRSPCSS